MKIIKSKEELRGYTTETLGMRKQKRVPMPSSYIKDDDARDNMLLLDQCRAYWDSLRDFRERRLRNRKYYRGDQWDDFVRDPESSTTSYITEEEYLLNQGKVPLKQNLVGKSIRNLVGQYLSNPSKAIVISRAREDAQATEMLTNALQCALQNNNSKILDIHTFREATMSGAPIQKIGYDYFKKRNLEDVRIDIVNPARIFFNTDVADPRLDDLRIIGEIKDTTVEDLISTFAKSPADEKKIRQIYSGLTTSIYQSDYGLDPSRIDNIDFYNPRGANKARVFEIWMLKPAWRIYAHDPMDGSYGIVDKTLAEIAEQNALRVKLAQEEGNDDPPLIEAKAKYEQEWYVKFLTPLGHCLFESKTMYKHEEHPYAPQLLPMVDGEVWGLIEDMIDQQRYINRLIIQLDNIISASAKGLLLFPEDLLPEGMTKEDVAKEWPRANGVIFFNPSTKHNLKPEQVSANSTNVGIHEMLAMQMNFFQDTTGIYGAIQGKEPNSGTPAALYAQQAQNASINTLELMTYFSNFQQKRDTKVLKVLTQFYDEKRYLAVNGRSISQNTKMYDPDLVKNLDFDIIVTQGSDTPVYRQLIDDTLYKLLEGQLIDLEMFLEHTSMPFADKLLSAVRQRKQQVQQGQMPDQMPPELMAQVNQQADPNAMKLINQFMGRKTAA